MNRVLSMGLMTILLVSCSTQNSQENHIYATWQDLEIDKCASAWLIKRFVDKRAEFTFYPVGELITVGTPFDTPDAELGRQLQFSVFENVMMSYGIDDWRVKRIAAVIHRLEVRSWEEQPEGKDALTTYVEESVRRIVATSETPRQGFERSFSFFDGLYADLRDRYDPMKN